MSEFLWQNGRRVDSFSIKLASTRDRSGFWLGDGLFETMLAESGRIFALERHLDRFRRAAQKVGLSTDEAAIDRGVEAALDWLSDERGQIRITLLSSGDLLISAKKHQLDKRPLRLVRYPFPKNEKSILAGIKTISYGENAAALRFAREREADDVLFVNLSGNITESAVANVLLWDGNAWATPTLESGCLPGVTRELLIEEFDVKERDFTIEDLFVAKALALTSSLRDLQGVSHFEDHIYPALGEVDRLRTHFQEWRAKNPNP